MRKVFGDRLRFAFRHFPLVQLHPLAWAAAEAAEAAGAQDRFWEMHDLLHRNQQALDPEDLLRYAALLELDMERFARELATRVNEPRVREDVTSGVRNGVHGTPTFFTNGIRHTGPWDAPSLARALADTARVVA